MYTFQRMNPAEISDKDLYAFSEKYIFTTREWLNFLADTQPGEPAVIRIEQDGRLVGFLYGYIVRKFGIKIFGSPFSGWSTCYMGLDVMAGEKTAIVKELSQFILRDLGCLYAEIIDRDITVEVASAAGFSVQAVDTLQLDFVPGETDDALMRRFKTKCRNTVRQFERRGATLEIAEPSDAFAEEYYEQLIDVFAKQGLVPTYDVYRVKVLLNALKDTDRLLCLRVRDPEGKSIATSIFFGYNRTFYFWGGASYRSGQKYLPNEYMLWTAIRHFRDKGMTSFDMVGVRDYKRKFGSEEKVYAKIILTRFKILLVFRNAAQKLFFVFLRFRGWIKRKR